MSPTQSSGTTHLTPQQIAEAYQKHSKQQSTSGMQSSGQSGQTSQNVRHNFDMWFSGFESCLKLIGEQEGTTPTTVNRNEIYAIVEKQQKAA